jgi:glycosyltransferase involved in cell wall biosynthesis
LAIHIFAFSLKTILFIGHDANIAGAQIVLLNILQELKKRHIPTHLLLEEGGLLEEQYRTLSSVTISPKPKPVIFGNKIDWVFDKIGILNLLKRLDFEKRQKQFEKTLTQQNIGLVFANTIATAKGYQSVRFLNVPLVLFVHELAASIKMYSQPEELTQLLKNTTHLITPSLATADYYNRFFEFPKNKISTFQIVDIESIQAKIEQAKSVNIRQKLNLPSDAVLIGSCGNAELRKGNDIFMIVAQNVINRFKNRPVYFIWIGISAQSELYELQRSDAEKMGLSERIIHIEPTPDVLQYVGQLDIFGLFSREDPYPLVVLEAALSEKPIVCFAGSGGASEFVEDDCGFVVPYLDVMAMSDKICYLIENQEIGHVFGKNAKQKVLSRHPTTQSIDKALAIIDRLILK